MATDAQELWASYSAQKFWSAFRAEIETDGTAFLMLTRESVRRSAVSDLAFAVSDEAAPLREIIRHDLSADARLLEHVVRLREIEAEFGYPETRQLLAALAADGSIARAERCEHTLALVAESFQQADELLALSRVDTEVIQQVNPTIQPWRVTHGMISHGGALRSHTYGAQRSRFPRSDGHGKPSVNSPDGQDGFANTSLQGSDGAAPEDVPNGPEGNSPGSGYQAAGQVQPSSRRRPKRALKPQPKKRRK